MMLERVRKLGLYLAYVQAFVVFFGAQFATIPFLGYKISLFRVMLAAMLIVLLFWLMFGQDRSRLCLLKARLFVLILPIALFLYTLVSFLWARNNSVDGWMKLLYFVFSYSLSSVCYLIFLRSRAEFAVMIAIMCVGAGVQAVIGTFEHLTGVYYFTSYADLFTTHPYFMKMRFPAAMQTNPNDFALLMFFGLHFTAFSWKLSKNSLLRVILSSLLLVEGYLIYAAGARAVMIGVLVSILYVGFARIIISRRMRAFAIFMLSFLILSYVLTNAGIQSRLQELADWSKKGTSEQIRLQLVKDGLRIFWESRGLGIGAIGVIAFHNFWIEILAVFGLPIFVLFLSKYVWCFQYLRRNGCRENQSLCNRFSLCITSVLVGFTFACLGPASCINIEWLGVVGALILSYIGLSISISKQHKDLLER